MRSATQKISAKHSISPPAHACASLGLTLVPIRRRPTATVLHRTVLATRSRSRHAVACLTSHRKFTSNSEVASFTFTWTRTSTTLPSMSIHRPWRRSLRTQMLVMVTPAALKRTLSTSCEEVRPISKSYSISTPRQAMLPTLSTFKVETDAVLASTALSCSGMRKTVLRRRT